MSDTARDEAIRRMDLRGPSETRMANEGQNNAGGAMRYDLNDQPYWDAAPMSEYPRMLYRKTNEAQYQEWADSLHQSSEERMVINKFDGMLCDITIAKDADEAERLAADGWDISPRAAHGLTDGLGAAVSAKDAEIAELRRQLAESVAQASDEPVKRGPGRPRNAENAGLDAGH